MESQAYRHRVTIEEKIETQDTETGDVSDYWFPLYEDVPASVLTGPGREFIAAAAKQAETTARIAFRWLPGITQNMRVLWDGRVFDIAEIASDLTGRRELRLRCTDGVNDG